MILSGNDWTKRGLLAAMAVGLVVGSARCSSGGESTASSGGGAASATASSGANSTAASSSQGSGGSCADSSCEVCAECLGRGPCADEKAACYGDIECDAFGECISKICGDNDTACKDACVKDHPKGAEEHRAWYGCVLCAPDCSATCAALVDTYPALTCP